MKTIKKKSTKKQPTKKKTINNKLSINVIKSLFVVATVVVTGFLGLVSVNATAPGGGLSSSFYMYSGSTPLANITPGTVLQSRTFKVLSCARFLTVDQLLYRSTSVLGQPTVNATSVVHPTGSPGSDTRFLSLQLAYDSLNPNGEPSVAFAGGNLPSGSNICGWLSSGVTVIEPDTEGQQAAVGEGRQYGMNTLDSIRAATSSPLTGLSISTPGALMGYSGGAWATGWATQLAPTYAPDVNGHLVGTAMGGVPVDAAHMVAYKDGNNGSSTFSSTILLGMIGLSRAYNFDFTPYLNPTGLTMYNSFQDSLGQAISQYKNVYMAEIMQPAYVDPNSIPGYTAMINNENMGLVGPATIPLYIMQGGSGKIEHADDNVPGIGNGDGATVTGDVRALALKICSAGTPVQYIERPNLDHLLTAPLWGLAATQWIQDRFKGVAVPNNCSSIAPGNSLAPEVSKAS